MFGSSIFFFLLSDFLCTYSISSQTWPLSLINPILVLLNSLFLFSPFPHEYCPRKAKYVNAKTATLRHCPERVFDAYSCCFRDYMRTDSFLGLWLWYSGYVFGFSQVALNGKNFLLSSLNVQFFLYVDSTEAGSVLFVWACQPAWHSNIDSTNSLQCC